VCILIIEDNLEHARAIEQALHERGVHGASIESYQDADAALRRIEDASATFPVVVIFDFDLGNQRINAGTLRDRALRAGRSRGESCWFVAVTGLTAEHVSEFSCYQLKTDAWPQACASQVAPLFDVDALTHHANPLAPPRALAPKDRVFLYTPDEQGKKDDTPEVFTTEGDPQCLSLLLRPTASGFRDPAEVQWATAMYRNTSVRLDTNAIAVQLLLRYRAAALRVGRPFGWEVLAMPKAEKDKKKSYDFPVNVSQYLLPFRKNGEFQDLVRRATTPRKRAPFVTVPLFRASTEIQKTNGAEHVFPLRLEQGPGSSLVEVVSDLLGASEGLLSRAHFVLTETQRVAFERWLAGFERLLESTPGTTPIDARTQVLGVSRR
jgi:CheY-like chemotaxis protein